MLAPESTTLFLLNMNLSWMCDGFGAMTAVYHDESKFASRMWPLPHAQIGRPRLAELPGEVAYGIRSFTGSAKQ